MSEYELWVLVLWYLEREEEIDGKRIDPIFKDDAGLCNLLNIITEYGSEFPESENGATKRINKILDGAEAEDDEYYPYLFAKGELAPRITLVKRFIAECEAESR